MNLIKITAAACMLLVANLSYADVRAGSKGNCPSGYTSYTRKGGDRMCKAPDKSASSAKSSSKNSKKK
jgi:hypothetical protein